MSVQSSEFSFFLGQVSNVFCSLITLLCLNFTVSTKRNITVPSNCFSHCSVNHSDVQMIKHFITWGVGVVVVMGGGWLVTHLLLVFINLFDIIIKQ